MAAIPLPPGEEVSALERFYENKSWSRRLLRRINVQTKLTWAFIFLMAVTLASYGFVSLNETRRKLKDNLTAQAQQASAMLAVLMPADLSEPAMRKTIGQFIENGPDLVFVSFMDADGRVVLTETPGGPAAAATADVRPGVSYQADDAAFGPHVVSTSAIRRRGGDQTSGYVRVGVSLRQYAMQSAVTTNDAVRVGLALLLVAVPTAWLVVRRMFKPIRQMVSATQRIAAGDLNIRVNAGRRDLIGDLARAFNHMVLTITHQQAALKQANDKLAEANRDLEVKIDQRTSQLETSNKQLSAEIAGKEDFLRAISHDLNAPLRNISGIVTMLMTKKRDQLDEDVRHRLERVKKNVDLETDLINELLELSRIKTRRGMMEVVELERMVWDLRGMFENDLRTKDIQFVVDSVLPPLHAEKPRIRQIFQNLIDNAIKYMGEGYAREIHVGCVLKGSEAEFYVRDTGRGIDADDIGKVFVAFRRGKDACTQAVAGKGIGLASVKSIIETYSGRIWVESEVGKGTTFRFTINGQYLPQLGGRTVLGGEECESLAA